MILIHVTSTIIFFVLIFSTLFYYQPEATEGVPTSKAEEMGHSNSAAECCTNIQKIARVINFKYILGAMFVFVVSALVASILHHQDLLMKL